MGKELKILATGKLSDYWNAWELRALILLSLLLQILLVVFGNRRKYMTRRCLGVFVGLAYLFADSVATFSLGEIARSEGTVLDPTNNNRSSSSFSGQSTNQSLIPLFWAPTVLVNLGGPDAITAYAMKDIEFEIESLLGTTTYVVVVIYVLIKLWGKHNLPVVAVPIFLVGIYNYVESIWMVMSKKFSAFSINNKDALPPKNIDEQLRLIGNMGEAKILCEAHMLLQMFKGLLSNLFLSYLDVRASRYIISLHHTQKEIFKLIEVELGLAYDVLHTKMTEVHFGCRVVLRSISFLFTISALVVFSKTIHKDHISSIDIIISYILLVGAIVLKIYSIMVFLFSDWTMTWIGMQNKAYARCFYRALWSSRLRSFFNGDSKRWSGLMAQHDLLMASLLREKFWDKFLVALVPGGAKIQGRQKVTDDLKRLIVNGLLQRSRTNNISTSDSLRTVLEERGREVLRTKDCLGDFGWSVDDLEFHQSLLVWHIATSICYWDEFHKSGEPGGALRVRLEMSRSLSNYMMYLAVEHPLLLPKGISGPRYYATKRDMMKITGSQLERTFDLSDRTSWDTLCGLIRQYKVTVQLADDDTVRQIREDASAFRGGLMLARSLLEKNFGSSEGKWEMISEVWLEMLIYAAAQCEWKEHAKALTRGGELITIVSLLKAHLGLTLQREPQEWSLMESGDRIDRLADQARDAKIGPMGDMAEGVIGVGPGSSNALEMEGHVEP